MKRRAVGRRQTMRAGKKGGVRTRTAGLALFLSLLLSGFVPAPLPASGNPPGQATEKDSIPIGLLLPDRQRTDLIRAARLAVEQANQAGGYRNRPFSLVVRSCEGPWGAGSKESVRLVYDDQVIAYLGALDGRNAHLAEQVAAKSHLLYLETRSSDPTLSQAYVPWFMRLVPSDIQQAERIASEIHATGNGRIAILTRSDYDTEHAVKEVVRALAGAGKPVLELPIERLRGEAALQEEIRNRDLRHLILPFHDPNLADWLPGLRRTFPTLHIYLTLGFDLGLPAVPGPADPTGIHRLLPPSSSAEWEAFDREFEKRFGISPPPAALYVFDGMNLVVRGVRVAGTDRLRVSDHILHHTHRGFATGTICFDDLGNRVDPCDP
ncbi:MAG: ABC transporter substrate-binding protein [Bacteroidales bacterium]